MRNPFDNGRKPPRNRFAEVDAGLDSALFHIRQGIAGGYGRMAALLARLRVTGFLRAVVELLGDGLTLGTAGAVLMLALALPAFRATEVDWRNQGDYAVTFLDRYGNEIGKRGIRHSDTVPLEAMPDYLIKAVLATEDRRFFDHFGIDVFGTSRALVENLRANAVVQGGSSITQQLAKNLFLSNERTLERKVKEVFLALWLEANLSKEEILKLYLDRAYMGAGNFGIAAATEFYFGKSVRDVTLAEAAMLAGLFKAPTRYAPHIDLPAARARANQVLTNMVDAGLLTEGQVIGARRKPATIIDHAASRTPDYFLDWAFTQVKAKVPRGDRTLTVRTTLDMNLEQSADESIETSLRQSGEQYRVRQGALVALEPDGAVRAMVGGRDYGESQFNRATDALRQPGSSFKPFVYATAMANGYTPKSVVPDAPISIGNWSPRNYGGGYAGPVSLTTALVKSINTVPVRLAQAIGRDHIVETAHRMGINTELLITRSLPLGAAEVTVLDMAGAYGAFASGGYKATPYAFTQIRNSSGEIVYDHARDEPPPERVLDETVTQEMNSMLAQVPEWGTGRRAKLEGIRTAGKTGTTSAYRDAWFVGFTGNYVAAVWFGNDDYQSTRNLTGGALPAEAWHRFMAYAHQGIELKPIPFVEPEAGPAVAAAGPADNTPAPERPQVLSARTNAQLLILERLLRGEAPEATVLGTADPVGAVRQVARDAPATPPAGTP